MLIMTLTWNGKTFLNICPCGVLAPNGKVYFVPSAATDILIIDKNASVPALDIKDCLSPHLNKY